MNGDIIRVRSVEDLETVIHAIEEKYSSWGAAEKQALDSDLNNNEITQEEYDRLISPGGAYYETYVKPAELLKTKVTDVFRRLMDEISEAHRAEEREVEDLVQVDENAAGPVFLNAADGQKITAALKEAADGLTAGLQTQNPLFFAELTRKGEELKSAGPLIHPLSNEEIESKNRVRETARPVLETTELNNFLALRGLIDRGMAAEAPKDEEAARRFREMYLAFSTPLLEGNRERTLNTLKERGISLREYILAAENRLESELKAAYTPPVQVGSLNLSLFTEPDNQDLKRCLRTISGKVPSQKGKSFLPDALSMLPPEDYPGAEKSDPLHRLVRRGVGNAMTSIYDSCDEIGGGLETWIPDLSEEKKAKLHGMTAQIENIIVNGYDDPATKFYHQDKIDAFIPAISEYRAILQSEYERLHRSGTNPVGELKARQLMIVADSIISGISYEDLSEKVWICLKNYPESC